MCAMTRDELLLTTLLGGDASTVVLAQAADRSERAARYGLTHLVKIGYVWSPERGRWRLTDAGRAIAVTIPQPSAAPAETHEPDATVTPSAAPEDADTRPTAAETAPSGGDTGSVPGWLWALGAIVLGVLALKSMAARPSTDPAPEPSSPAPIPAGWPYNGWQSWVR